MNKVAIILTYHNRKIQTTRCVEQLIRSSKELNEIQIEFFVCDDGSTDGTSLALQKICKKEEVNIHIAVGNGNLFWARGMALAMEAAEKSAADFYLMVNDDVDFNENVISVILNTYEIISEIRCAIVGSTKDAITGEHTYGGQEWRYKRFQDQIKVVKPSYPIEKCNRANWNCFLLPVSLYNEIGRIDSYYEHGSADFDYSKRIVDAGAPIYVADKYIGFCSRNSAKGKWTDTSMPMRERIKAMHKKNGLPPKSQWYFCKKMYGNYAVWYFIRPYLSIIKSSVFKKFK